jgi:membrane protein YfhO
MRKRSTAVTDAPRLGHDWVPSFAGAWAAVVFALCTLALGFPALAGGFLVNPHSDQFLAGYAFREFGAASLRSGHGFPLWNPYLFGGLPYVAAMHGDIFYPTFLLRMAMPTDVAMTWSFIIHIFLAGLFTYLFLRAWGVRYLPSIVGGVAYLMCGPISAYVSPGHDGKLYVSALLPLTLFLLVRGIRDGKSWVWGALAIVIGLAVLSPHPQLLQYMLIASGAFALYLALAKLEQPDGTYRRLERSIAVRRLLYALGAVVLGLVIGAIQFLPVREYVPFSPRAGGRDYDYATSYSLPIEEMINFYLPEFSGIMDRYWGRNVIHLHSEYLGAATLFLGGLGLTSRRRGFRWFWIGALIISVLWALGGGTPFYHLIYVLVPGTKFFRAPSTMLFLIGFCVAVLAALGTEEVIVRGISRRYVIGWLVGAAIVALLASVGGITNMAKVISASWAGDQLEDAINANNAAVVIGAWRAFLVVGLAALIAWMFERRRLDGRMVGWAFIVLVALDLFSVEKQYWLFSPRAASLYHTDPALEYVKHQAEPARVLAMSFMRQNARDPMLQYDGPMADGVRLVTGYHGNEIGRFQRLCGGDPGRQCDPRVLLSPSFWRQENVRYLYTDADTGAIGRILAGLNLPPLERVVGPVTDAAGAIVYLYRLPGENPPAWIAPVFVKAPEDQALAAVLDPRFDPTRVAILDTNSAIAAKQVQTLPPSLGIPVRVTHYAPGAIQVDLASSPPAGSALIVSENYFSGWTALVDGKPAPIDRAEYNLIGVELPPGARQVSLQFDDRAYEHGKIITLVAIIAALALTVFGLFTSRRSPAVA